MNPFDKYSEDPQIHMETLLFEYLCGFRIREEQAKIMHELVENIFNKDPKKRDFAVVFQMIMGGGKTSVILAQMAKLAAKNEQVPIFLAHHSQYASLKANLVNTQYKRLNQDVSDLDFNREDLASIKILKFINFKLNAAKENGHMLLLKTGFLLILRLEFIDQIKALKDPQNLDPLNLERIEELAKILGFIKENALLLGDEVDCSLNILEEINFPSGLAAIISRGSLDLIKQVYATLSNHPEISALLKLENDDQSLVAKQKLFDKIFPQLVDSLIDEYPPLSGLIPPQNYQLIHKSLKDYMLGKIDARLKDGVAALDDDQFFDSLKIFSDEERKTAQRHLEFLRYLYSLKTQVSESVQQGLAAAALTKELCTEILPLTLGKSFNHNYGFTEEGKVIPFLGVDYPNQTEFGNIYVTACCYFQAALNKGVDATRLKKYRDRLREASFYHSELYHCPPEQSSEAQHFKALTGLELHQEWTERDLTQAIDEINGASQRCLDFYGEFSSLFLRYHTALLNCGPIALAHMAKQFIGCSATLWNKDTFAKEIAESCITQEGTEGRILVKLSQDLAAKNSYLSLVDRAEPHSILQAVLDKRGDEALPRLRALIDASGMLKRYTNRQVAEEILKFKPLETEIDAVVFLNKVGDKEEFSLLKRGTTKPMPLLTTSRQEMERHGVPLNRIFIYFDELRATGSDVPFKANGIVAKTFDPFSTTMRTDLQANLRARNFFHEQVVDTIIQRETLEGFVNYDPQNPESCLNAPNFFLTAIRNQTKLKQTQLVHSVFEQIREIYRSLIVKKLVHSLAKGDKEEGLKDIELFHAAEWLFYSTFKDDPIALFLDLQKEVPAHEVVQGYFNQISKRFQNTCAQYIDHSDVESIAEATEKILDWSKENLLWNVPYTDTSVYLEKQVMLQKQHENQLQVNVEMQKEIQKELQKYAVRVDAPVAKFIPWKKLKDIPQSFDDYKSPDRLTFSDLLQRVPYDPPYHQIFPKDLYLTENLARSRDADLSVFGKEQKNAYHILLVKQQDTFQTLFIDLQEAAFWRKQIKQYQLEDCWLVDLDGHSLNEGRSIPENALKTLQRAQWWGHFFNGNASYLRGYPSLVQQELKNENYEIKYRFLLLKAANDSLQTRILTIDPLLAEKPLAAPVFQFNNKQEEEKWLSEIRNLDVDKLNQLPFHFARYLSNEQIPLLKRPGYFTYLPFDKFEYILPQQVSLIPNYRLQYLCKCDQVEIVPPDKVCHLKGKALEYLPEKYLDRIKPDTLADLIPAMQIKYQKIQIERMGLVAFARMVCPPMASVILPECVALLSDDCLPFLQTPEQLEHVPVEKYHLLKSCQFHLLPRKHWHLLQKEDYQKYCSQEKLPEDAEAFIQQMNAEWINEVDPRLTKFFSEKQVKRISQPKPIKYLNVQQLSWLDASLAEYLETDQIAKLAFPHRHLIETYADPKIIRLLSDEGLQELSIKQVRIIDDRETLLRLNSKFYLCLQAGQIALLQPTNVKDQEIIKQFDKDQLKGVEKKILLSFLPYLNDAALKSIQASVIGEAQAIPCEVRRKLTSRQMQCFLGAQKNRKVSVATFLKEMAAFQWQGLDRVFIESFFAKLSKSSIQCVPKTHVSFLPKMALFKWHNAESKKAKVHDILIGISSLAFYPFVLLTALILTILSQQKKASSLNIFRNMAITPLRLISRESYYRLISE